MSLPRYARYKDSGVEWLGDIPQSWTVKSLRRFSCVVQTGPFGSQLHSDEYVSGGTPVINPVNLVNGIIVPSQDISVPDKVLARLPHQRLQSGDVVFSRRGELGRCALVTKRESGWLCGTGSMILRLPHGEYHSGYLSQYLSLGLVRQYFESFSIGAIMDSLSSATLLAMPMIVPPVEIQASIVAFVTRENAKIDALVAEQRRLIELLKEKRQAVIAHAVTKGLNPDAPMKPSGIEWLGDVPAHWEVGRVKNYFRTCSGGTPDTSQHELYYSDEENGIPWVRTTDLNNDVLRSVEVFITEQALSDTACSVLPRATVMVAMYGGDGTVGKNGILAISAAINQAICGVLPSATQSSEYAFRFMQHYRPYWMIGAESSRKDPNISQERVRNAPFLRPPRHEQEAIVSFLETELGQLDALTAEAQRAIDLLQERRTALISAAVTGKIDVRGLAEAEAVEEEAAA